MKMEHNFARYSYKNESKFLSRFLFLCYAVNLLIIVITLRFLKVKP